MNFSRFLTAAVLFLVLAFSLGARARPEDIIVNDPQTRSGVLGNGLTYYVRANATPANMAELRLVVAAGSLQEDDDQQGLAHFTEHMLFNGTEAFPGNELIDVLESFGMEFGPEINAYTAFDRTVYRLTVSTAEQEQFHTGLDVLEEWAFNATLDEGQFEKERLVIHEEWRMKRGAQARIQDQTYPVLFHGSRYADRRPIGDMDVVLNAPHENLLRYYKDWYRPDLMAVIAVGDFNPNDVVQLITERFGRHARTDKPRPKGRHPIPPHDETLVKVVKDAEAIRSSVQIYTKRRPAEIRFRPNLRQDLSEHLLFAMLNQRLGERSRSQDAPFLYGYGFTDRVNKDTALAGLMAIVEEDGILQGLEALWTEAERARRFGFLESELERARKDGMAWFESLWKSRGDRDSEEFIALYLDAYLYDDFYPSIDWQWEAVQDLLPAVNLEDVARAVQTLLNDESRVVIVSGPETLGVVEEEDVLNILARVEGMSLGPWEEKVLDAPLVPHPPSPGRILSQKEIPETDIEMWELSNGATVLLKSTDFRADEIFFRAMSSGGHSLVEDERFISSLYAVDAVEYGGVGEFSADMLRKALAGRNIEFEAFVGSSNEGFVGSSTPDDLESLLQILFLHQTAPRHDAVAWEVLMRRNAESLENRSSSPMNLYGDLLWETLYDNHFRMRSMTLERLEEASLDEALAVYTERFSGADDFTYVFVGDVTREALEPLVERWIGGLPSGVPEELWQDRGIRNTAGVKEVSLQAGAEPLSVVSQVWTGDWDGSFVQRYRLQSLAAALEMALTRIMREESGGTYAVNVVPHLSVAPHRDYRVIVQYSCNPQRVEELIRVVKDTVDSWRSLPPDEKFAADVASSQQRSLTENLQRNDWWVNQITFAVMTRIPPEDMMNRRELYNSLTPELLSETAGRYLADSRYVEAILYPQPEASSEPGKR